jgi:uncharacterized membrane protein
LTPQAGLLLSALAFVGTHFLMSHPLRAPLVRTMGEGPFRGLYSLVSLITFGAMVYFYWSIGDEPPIFVAPGWAWPLGALLMWFASILLAGSFFGNPALPGVRVGDQQPVGVFAITRHPMMWSFAIWAAAHWALIGTPKAMVLDLAIAILALGGAALQDRKKEKTIGDRWIAWQDRTSFVPFARGSFNPGLRATLIGTLFYLAATWAHPMPLGLWRWIG